MLGSGDREDEITADAGASATQLTPSMTSIMDCWAERISQGSCTYDRAVYRSSESVSG